MARLGKTTEESSPERDSFPRRRATVLENTTKKEGAHGGTMGSPMLEKES